MQVKEIIKVLNHEETCFIQDSNFNEIKNIESVMEREVIHIFPSFNYEMQLPIIVITII